MSPKKEYKHNSDAKEVIRQKWVEYIKFIKTEAVCFITFPAEELQDLELFKKEGLINWEETETGAYRITEGQAICFEKNNDIWIRLRNKLVDTPVLKEIGSHLQVHYHKLLGNGKTFFPVDAINLDYDSNISHQNVKFSQLIKLLFEFQAVHKKDFCLFLTVPEAPEGDAPEFIDLLDQTLETNLQDEHCIEFQNKFKAIHDTKDKLNYKQLSIISLTKIIIKESSKNSYFIEKNEFYTYGGNPRRIMMVMLFHFKYIGPLRAGSSLYLSESVKALEPIQVV